MAYEILDDIQTVVLGGVDKKTGKKNPTQLEGYFLRVETRPNRYNPNKPQNFYIFQTSTGQVGIYGKAGIDREMKKATLGVMTLVKDTGQVLDTGKGNPMKVFQISQDKANVLDAASLAQSNVAPQSDEDYISNSEDDETDEELVEEIAARAPVAPKVPLKTPSAERQAALQALLSKSRK